MTATDESAYHPAQSQDLGDLYRRRNELFRQADAPENDEKETRRLCDQVRELEDVILAREPASLVDVGIQVRTLRASLDGQFRGDTEALPELDRLAVRLDRLAGAETPLAALWREHGALVAKINEGAGTDVDRDRCDRIEATLDEARPTDLGGIAVQAKWLSTCLAIGFSERDEIMARSIAERLEALAGLALPARPHA